MNVNTTTPRLTIRPGDARGRTRIGWLDSRHSFSFGQYDDPANMSYRTLRVINDDHVAPGAGFGEHGHDNMEILTWVLDGALRHRDSLGHEQPLTPGELQVMSAGRGIRHSEFNDSAAKPVHFLQIWITPRSRNAEPRYDQRRFDPAKTPGRWITVAAPAEAMVAPDASSDGVAPLAIDQDATLRIVRVAPDAPATVNATGGYHYLHVATGRVTLGGRELSAGDAVTWDDPGEMPLVSAGSAEVLWFALD